MSAAAVVDGCFLSALQPNNSSRTAYALPSDGPCSDAGAKARRVREQVRLRLAEKKSPSMGRLTDDDALLGPTVCEYSLPAARSFSSRSMIHTPTRIMSVPTTATGSRGFSSRSAVETSSVVRASVAQSSFQSRSRRTKSLCQAETTDQGAVPPPPLYAGALRRTLSGTLAPRGSGVSYWAEEEPPVHFSYKGPSHRTISRIANRQQHGTVYSQDGWGGEACGGQHVPQWYVHRPARTLAYHASTQHAAAAAQRAASLHRAASLRSVRSVGKGLDVLDGASVHSNDRLGGMQGLDLHTAVRYLSEPDSALQILGAAYIQHQCYHSNDCKNQVRLLHGIPLLVELFSSDNLEVQRFATGATRNLIYENADNKVTLIDAGGVARLVAVLGEPDEELRKNITGVLWNLSSRDNLKEKLCREALSELSSKVLIPLCASVPLSPSEKDIFNNTTGCLRNLSSVNQRTREKMRDTSGLVDSLVSYIKQEVSADDKGLENSVCVLRNLSYQLYSELPHSVRLRLEGPTRGSAPRDAEAIGCFTMYSKKNAEHQRNQSLAILSEVSREPHGAEWLWHPRVVTLYKQVLQNGGDTTSASREAAIGALQNLTAGDVRWSSVLSVVVLEQERMLPTLLDLLDTDNEAELRPLTALLRNLARHAPNKDLIAKNMVNVLVSKLPADGLQKTPSSETVVNMCGALNHLVTCSSLAARDISYFNGLPKLVGIKTAHDNSSGGLKASRAASTVLCNMFQYSKLHKDYKLKGFARRDFADATI
ncbi:plakophilin-3-like [Corythoichthys intestinalis]|uniref:plakophilin-3-like n=1 Tax=Corythoichthys intestinalis TaxID=161448 RepID=UPI0025A67A00|nr:plakophilin-3-like [Corythoichthys intestinalis]